MLMAAPAAVACSVSAGTLLMWGGAWVRLVAKQQKQLARERKAGRRKKAD